MNMLKTFAIYGSLIVIFFAAAGYQGYSISSLFTDSKHMGPNGGHAHSYFSGHYHK